MSNKCQKKKTKTKKKQKKKPERESSFMEIHLF